jgi:glycosyltransferase involved in cell wall biosynthesis
MRRIAYASPVNPAPSGISDYSEELLPYLGRYAEITLYLDDRLRPSNPQLARHLAIRPISRLARDQRRRPFDAVLYHLGNSAVHASIWRAMQRVPGVAVMHEFVLHHFMLQYYATVLGDIDRYRAEAARRYGPEGDHIANLMMHGRFTEAAFELPFCEDVLACADGLIAHSRYVLTRAAAMRPDLPAAHVPMGVPLPPALDRAAARARRGLPADAPILASFGHINPYKRVGAVLRAIQSLQGDFPGMHYLLVGSVSPSYDLRGAVARAGLSDAVIVTGYVDRAAFEDYVAAADICINLRHPTAGETSASLLRLLGAGRPTLVTASGSFTELPPGTAAQVDPDASEGDLIQAYCRLLLQRPDLAAQLGEAARAYVAVEHTLEGAALGYMRFLSARYGWEPPQPLQPPLWELEERAPVAPAAPVARPAASVPAPAPTDGASAAHPLVARVGQALAELGATEHDQALLAGAARAATELIGADDRVPR